MLKWYKIELGVQSETAAKSLLIRYMCGRSVETVTRSAQREHQVHGKKVANVSELVAMASRLNVAGASKVNSDGIERRLLMRKLKIPSQLKLRIECGNPYDRDAVAILNADSQHLGYLPRESQIKRFAKHCYMSSGRSYYSVWSYA